MFPRPLDGSVSSAADSVGLNEEIGSVLSQSDALVGIDDVQKSLNRSRASVYRYTNTDPRNLNPPFNPRKLNPEYRSDQKVLAAILEELRLIRTQLDGIPAAPSDLASRRDRQERPAA